MFIQEIFVDGSPFIATGKLSQLFVKSMVSKPLAEPEVPDPAGYQIAWPLN
jgi:hypothetical protein